MAEPHALAHFAVPFAMTMWWTKSWLLDPVTQRWRFVTAAIVSTIAWVYLAYTATRVTMSSGGVQIVYGSTALGYLCVFLAIVSFASIALGLLLWTEEAGEETVSELRRQAGGVIPGGR